MKCSLQPTPPPSPAELISLLFGGKRHPSAIRTHSLPAVYLGNIAEVLNVSAFNALQEDMSVCVHAF